MVLNGTIYLKVIGPRLSVAAQQIGSVPIIDKKKVWEKIEPSLKNEMKKNNNIAITNKNYKVKK
jgi:hypothetical protein